MKTMLSPITSSNSFFKKQNEMFIEALLLIRIFYFSIFATFAHFLYNWVPYSTKPHYVSSWLADWIWQSGNQYSAVTAIVSIAIFSSLALAIAPFNVIARWINFISAQIFFSYHIASSGYANHEYYGFTLLTFVFMALPSKSPFSAARRHEIHQTLTCLWLAAGSLVTIYFLIGIGNLVGGFRQLFAGEISLFSPVSLAYFILDEIQTAGRSTILSDLVINHYSLFWIGVFIVLIKKISGPYIWLFRPHLLPVLGIGLVLFHLFNAFAFGLPFVQLTFQVSLFLILTPTRNITAKLFSKLRREKYFKSLVFFKK